MLNHRSEVLYAAGVMLMRVLVVLLVVAAAAIGSAAPAQTVFIGSGSSTTQAVTDFRNATGPLNANVSGSFNTGRREINWDGVPDAFAAPNNLPANFFNANSPRGAVFSTPGSGFQVSANAANAFAAPIEFGNIDPSYPQVFTTFSAQRLFTPIGSNILDVSFFIPGSNTPAFVTGFGVVFSDVDIAGSTSLSFFGANNLALGTWAVPSIAGNETLSFLGVLFGDAIVSRVRITSGNTALGPGVLDSGNIDLVVMDDFIFGEPTLAAAVPEPASWALMLLGFVAIGVGMRRRSSDTATLRMA